MKEEGTKAASDEPLPSFDPCTPTKSSDLAIFKITRTLKLLKRQTRELEKRIEVTEATVSRLKAGKVERLNKVAEDEPEKTTGTITRDKQIGKWYRCGASRTMLMFCIISM
jgi:predicted RNase H-like nuclease (RuvC/YqgF family)